MSRALVATLAAAAVASGAAQNSSCSGALNLYGGSYHSSYINGTSFNLSAYQGRVLLIPKYTATNYLISTLNTPAFTALGWPCNQFGGQEPGDNDEILNTLKYVRPGGGYVPMFDLAQKVDVNGAFADPIFGALRGDCPAPGQTLVFAQPLLWTPVTTTDVAWNFESWLVGKDGRPFRRYATEIDSRTLLTDIQTLLAQ